ncbi:DUF4328 domain-containing protein [Janibacter indicus]|uniref:DUF4328 domain-containing protein n=1 Tax=Janibacter indicus TaxID=857417 RepID=A0A1W2CRP6_9MICO|nr:DUF4328 domain-containing protein [Janibacter indicus]SMC87889.1 protein of unknown function [Janibacter indicus]
MPKIHVTSPFADEHTTPVGPPPSTPTLAAGAALATALTATASWVAAAVVITLRRDELRAWVVGPDTTSTTYMLISSLLGLGVLALLVGIVTTGWWLIALRGVGEWANPGFFHRRASWWGFAGWVVPIVNLWFPYQVVADASRAVGSRVGSYWPWWIAWLLMGAGSVLDSSGDVLVEPGDIDRWALSLQVNAAIAVVALVLWWRIVRAATAAAQQAVRVTS